MKKIAVCNVSSFGRDFPEFITELEQNVGPVEKMRFPSDVDQKELAKALEGFTYVIVGTHPDFKKEFFEINKDVKLLARHGLGINNIDVAAADASGVLVTKESPVIERDAVAEHAVSLLHALVKKLPVGDYMVKNKEWEKDRVRTMGKQIRGAVTGIIGFGNIGQRTGQIMKNAYDNELIVYDPYLPDEIAEKLGAKKSTLDELLEKSDFIFLHCQITNENRHMINESSLSKMKKDAILINCARGALVDEEAIASALEKGNLFAYGADVAEKEPINNDNGLLKAPNTLLTPHVGVYNLTCTRNMNRKVMDDIYCMEKGERPTDLCGKI